MNRCFFLKILTITLVTALLVSGVIIWFYPPSEQEETVIRIFNTDWDSIDAASAIAEYIIEEGYGYRVENVYLTSNELLTTIPSGKVDLAMEMWKQNYMEWYEQQIEEGNIINLGPTYEGSPQFWIIPKWMAEEYNITTVYDMAEHWELFRDPEDPFKGIFYNGVVGWTATIVNEVKMESYGLSKYYNLVSPGTAEGLETVFVRSQENNQSVFGYYWAPTALAGAYDWYILEEPPYTDEYWEDILAGTLDEDLRPVDNACAYPSPSLDKIIHKGMLEKAPDVVEMLEKMHIGLNPIQDVLAWASENDIEGWEEAAAYYLENYEDTWKNWVTPQAYQNIINALEKAE